MCELSLFVQKIYPISGLFPFIYPTAQQRDFEAREVTGNIVHKPNIFF